jgi:hypothetical protein
MSCGVQVKKWQALNNKRYAEKRKYGYTQVRPANAQHMAWETAPAARTCRGHNAATGAQQWWRSGEGEGEVRSRLQDSRKALAYLQGGLPVAWTHSEAGRSGRCG